MDARKRDPDALASFPGVAAESGYQMTFPIRCWWMRGRLGCGRGICRNPNGGAGMRWAWIWDTIGGYVGGVRRIFEDGRLDAVAVFPGVAGVGGAWFSRMGSGICIRKWADRGELVQCGGRRVS